MRPPGYLYLFAMMAAALIPTDGLAPATRWNRSALTAVLPYPTFFKLSGMLCRHYDWGKTTSSSILNGSGANTA